MATTPTIPAADDARFLQEIDALLRDVELPDELFAVPAAAHAEPRAVPLKLAPATRLLSKRPESSPSLMKSAMPEPMKPSEPRKKTSSQRQKEELSYLRSTVEGLEQRLTTLKTNQSSGSGDESDRFTAATSIWERLARQELKKRDQAKFENAQLRERLESQIKVAKSLERILRKRQVWDELQRSKRHCTAARASTNTESELFTMLSASVDARLPLIDQVLEANGLTSATVDVSKSGVAHSTKSGLSINFVDASIMPFDLRSTADTIWKHARLNTFDLPNCTATARIIEQTDTTLAITRVMTFGAPSESRSTMIHFVSKRVVHDNHVVMVWESVSETAAAPFSAKPKVEISHQGWVKLVRAPASDGSVASMIRSYVRMAPTFTDVPPQSDGCERLHQHVSCGAGVLTDVLISSYRQSAQFARQAIENELMDEYFKTKA